VVFKRLGAKRSDVIAGPRFGVDNAVIRIGDGRVLIATTDPLSYIPSLGPSESAWLSVNLVASDLATSGFPPQYGIFDFNLPPRMPNRLFANYWKSFHYECKRLGLTIIGGHTGRYEGCDYTVIGAGVMYAIGLEERYLISSMAQPGDDIILTKGAAIETTAVLARTFPKAIRKVLGENLFEKARTYLHQVSTVKDCLTATSMGVHEKGVTAMHDATEGGVMAAVFELASASNLGAELDLDAVPISPETEGICKLFRINPLTSLSEGSLIMTCDPNKTRRMIGMLRMASITSSRIGRLTKVRDICCVDPKGTKRRIHYPKFDPYWSAYWKATTKRWK